MKKRSNVDMYKFLKKCYDGSTKRLVKERGLKYEIKKRCIDFFKRNSKSL